MGRWIVTKPIKWVVFRQLVGLQLASFESMLAVDLRMLCYVGR